MIFIIMRSIQGVEMKKYWYRWFNKPVVNAKFGQVPIDSLSLRHPIEESRALEIIKYAAKNQLWHFPPILVIAGKQSFRVIDGHHRVSAAKKIKEVIGYPFFINAWIVDENEYAVIIQKCFSAREPERIYDVRNYIRCGKIDGNKFVEHWECKYKNYSPIHIRIRRATDNEQSEAIDTSNTSNEPYAFAINQLEVATIPANYNQGDSNRITVFEISLDNIKAWANLVDAKEIGVALEISANDAAKLESISHIPQPVLEQQTAEKFKPTYRTTLKGWLS